MAANSKREQILERMVTTLSSISQVKKVQRVQPYLTELANIPDSQFPFIAVLGGVPVPDKGTGANNIKSVLTNTIFAYGHEAKTPDTAISNLLDDIWAALYQDPLLNGERGKDDQGNLLAPLAISIVLEPGLGKAIFEPHFSFKVTVKITYAHTKQSI